MPRKTVVAFLEGCAVGLLTVMLVMPILLVVADLLGWPSFRVGWDPLIVYEFTRCGPSVTLQMPPLGTVLVTLLAGSANLSRHLLIKR